MSAARSASHSLPYFIFICRKRHPLGQEAQLLLTESDINAAPFLQCMQFLTPPCTAISSKLVTLRHSTPLGKG